jgi:1,4-alpha-glucan branching enzyme
VHLEATHPSARQVCIAGSFNDWNPADMIRLGSDKWTIDLTLPPGSYEYRLIVDGQWMPDPNASRTTPNPFGEPNSLLIVPG